MTQEQFQKGQSILSEIAKLKQKKEVYSNSELVLEVYYAGNQGRMKHETIGVGSSYEHPFSLIAEEFRTRVWNKICDEIEKLEKEFSEL